MRLEFAREALADLDTIYLHGLKQFGRVQAELYADGPANAARLICAYPTIAPMLPNRTDGLRRRSAGVHSLFFTVDSECVRIVRVLHQRMDAERQFQIDGG